MWKTFEELKDDISEVDMFDLPTYKGLPVMRVYYMPDYCDPERKRTTPVGYMWEIVGEKVEIPLDSNSRLKFFVLNLTK